MRLPYCTWCGFKPDTARGIEQLSRDGMCGVCARNRPDMPTERELEPSCGYAGGGIGRFGPTARTTDYSAPETDR